MFEKFTTENADNFRQRYEGTFGFYRDGETNKRILTKLNYIRNDYCGFVDSRGVEYKLYPNSEKDIGFEFIPPRSDYYNTVDGAVLVKRVAARQFQRGLSSKNTAIYQLESRGLDAARVDFPMLNKIYLNPVAIRDAFAKKDSLPSVAISKQLALTEHTVYLFEKQIGTYAQKGTHFAFKLEEPDLWRTEINDALKSLHCTVEVA